MPTDDLTERPKMGQRRRQEIIDVLSQKHMHVGTTCVYCDGLALVNELFDDNERLRAALADMAQDWCCLHHPDDTHVEVLMPVELFKEFRDE